MARPSAIENLSRSAIPFFLRRPNGAGHEAIRNVEVCATTIQVEVIRISWSIRRRERYRRLPVVPRARSGIAGLELQAIGQTTIGLQHQRVIGRLDCATNFGELKKSNYSRCVDLNGDSLTFDGAAVTVRSGSKSGCTFVYEVGRKRSRLFI